MSRALVGVSVLVTMVSGAVLVAPALGSATSSTTVVAPAAGNAAPGDATRSRSSAAAGADQSTRPDVESASAGQAPAAVPVSRQEAQSFGPPDADGRLLVEVVGRRPAAAIRRADPDAVIVGRVDGLVLARISSSGVARLTDGGFGVRRPVDVRQSSGETAIDTSSIGAADAAGADPVAVASAKKGPAVKVGVVGLFDLDVLRRQQRRHLVPAVPAGHERCFTNGGRCPFGTKGFISGNVGAANVVSQYQNVELYLAETGGLVDIRNAIDWFAENDVAIVVMLRSVPWDAPGDGTGPADALVDRAVRKGITWVNIAGDTAADPAYDTYAGAYWRGDWKDRDKDGWLDFAYQDESLGAYCGSLYGLRWSDWGGPLTDYDLYVSDATRGPNGVVDGTDLRLLGGRDQSKKGATPLEANNFTSLCNHDKRFGPVYDADGDNFVSLWIKRTNRTSASSSGDTLEVLDGGGYLEYSETRRSHQLPFSESRNPGLVSVGGLNNRIGNAGVTGTSAQGPTNDKRAKPDLVAPACFIGPDWSESNCNEVSDQGDLRFATFSSAGLVAGRLAGYEASEPIVSGVQVRWIIATWSKAWGNPVEIPSNESGFGVLQERVPDSSSTPAQTWTLDARRLSTSPAGSAGDLDRTFSSRPDRATSPYPKRPAILRVTVNGARRQGTVELWTRTQYPGSGMSVPVARSAGLQVFTVYVDDARQVFTRVTSGGDVTVSMIAGISADEWALVPTTDPVRALTAGTVTPGRRTNVHLSAASMIALHSSTDRLAVQVTIDSSTGPGQLAVGTTKISYPAGRSTTSLSVRLESDLVLGLRATTRISVQLDVWGAYQELYALRDVAEKSYRVVPVTPTRLADAQVVVDAPTVIDVGAVDGVNDSTPFVWMTATIRDADSAGLVSIRTESGTDVPVWSFGTGTTTGAFLAPVHDQHVTLTSSVSASVRLTAVQRATAGPAYSVATQPSTVVHQVSKAVASADGSVVAAIGTRGRTSGQMRVHAWHRDPGTMDSVDVTTDGKDPDAPAMSVAVSADGTSVAFVSSATNLVGSAADGSMMLYVRDLGAGTTEAFPLVGEVADGLDGTRVIAMSADLRTLVTGAGTVARISADRSSLEVVHSYTGFVGNGLSNDGTVVLLTQGSDSYIATVGQAPDPVLSRSARELLDDGTGYVVRRAIVDRGGASRYRCSKPSGDLVAADADGSTIVSLMSCNTLTLPPVGAVIVQPNQPDVPIGAGDFVRVHDVSDDGSTVVVGLSGDLAVIDVGL